MKTIINKNSTGTSFWNFIKEYKKVEIPIIQRDYAQGRNDERTKKIRGLFLDSLFNILESKEGTLELDFVYGKDEKGVFQPLDGQQRLTTLFLLHWFLAYKLELVHEEEVHFKKFTYKTRISSKEFCGDLITNSKNLGEGKPISEKIKDASWFFLSWKKDPTIKAMLVMLDSIEERLEDKLSGEIEEFWNQLISNNSPITFHRLPLNDIGLTDDLYIKMNARGKPLTAFENFKARFQKHITESGWEREIGFSKSIDTVWTDLFWKYRGEDDAVDNEFVNFIAAIAIDNYAENQFIYKDQKEVEAVISIPNKKNITDEAISRKRIENRIDTLSKNPEEIEPRDFNTEESYNSLIDAFDIYSKRCEDDRLILKSLPLWGLLEDKTVTINRNQKKSNNLFIEIINDKTTYKQRVLFYAQTKFLLKNEAFKQEAFSDWMRVVRNIVENSSISNTNLIGIIGLIKELSSGSADIYKYLNDVKIKSVFAQKQMEEEIMKAKIIGDKDNKQVIFEIEDTVFFKGKVLFALSCIDYAGEENDVFNRDLLVKLCEVVRLTLSGKNISNEFRRALLTIDDNKFYHYWHSWSYKTNSRKRKLILDVGELKHYFTQGRWSKYLRILLLKLCEKDKSLSSIIEDFQPSGVPNWKLKLIKEPRLLDEHCRSKYIGIPDGKDCCFLFNDRIRPRSREDCEKLE